MSEQVVESLEKSIIEKLRDLTDKGSLKWVRANQTYSTTLRGFIFEIEDSGQDWLIISKEDEPQNVESIMDFGDKDNVGLLLDSIKRQATTKSNGPPPESHQSRLSNIFEVINQEA